jgi:transcription initiation factor IIE alpha subunit
MDTIAIVLKILEEQGIAMKSGEIAEKTGIDKKEVDKAIGKLKKEEKIFSPKNCFYAIKK